MNPQSRRYQWHRVLYAVRRRRLAGDINRLFDEIVSRWDQKGFIERFRKDWDPFEFSKASKYLNLDWWLREAIFRYLTLDIPRNSPPLNVMDMGMGAGYFLVVCRHLGHHVTGLDVNDESLYNECQKFFDLPRITHRIQAMQPLPELTERVDLATAFMTCFNQHEDKTPWEVEPWRFFLEDLRGRLSDRGRVAIKFNLNSQTGQFYSPSVKHAISHCGYFRARFFLDYVFLDAK